jgi:hypothetical protein
VSGLSQGPSELTEEDLWAHEEVVEALMSRRAVLPMRLGTVLADDAAVRELLRSRREELAASLDRVRGAVELAVRAAIDVDPAPPGERATSGTEYLLERLDARRTTEAAVHRVHDPLAGLARESSLRIGVRGEGRFQAAYLVDRDRVGPFKERVEALERERAARSLTCTGPWPPYSFVGGERER